ncbi:ankyrin repeat domain-containing protein [Bacillus tianshenii]|uniref:ankyrin repeat domain-containing protein n=1 Tax=Sutcliffiella tianshenii TaxID=1463404 RepID=UPI001CD6AAB2|nr:ankyrin repeat domain-containing protein [Bacillus tianshenii]MCA1319566.1 ankyrin repeat domain-containing protein [Bacillus tianshenii]
MKYIYEDKGLGAEVVNAIRSGDTLMLKRLLADNPGITDARLIGNDYEETGTSRTLLHVVADWPGHFPNGAASVGVLVDAGADVNARFTGHHSETPLHWAASSNDIEVLDALLDAGADMEADGAVIAGGTPLDDAVAFAQWKAARRLVERGAKTKLWTAAGLGLMDQVQKRFAGGTPPTEFEITQAFWLACHGGQLNAAQYLLKQGADLQWIGYDGLTPYDAAVRSEANELIEWLSSKGAKSAGERKQD